MEISKNHSFQKAKQSKSNRAERVSPYQLIINIVKGY